MTTMRALLVLLSVPLIFYNPAAYAQDSAGCPEGAEMSDCTGCSDHCQPPDTMCIAKCKPGCKCKQSGYVLKDNKKCVLESECCPPGAEMSSCIGCSARCNPPQLCTKECKTGCKCKQEGYAIKDDLRCVPLKEC
ncbi:uncharacterized protein ACMZJ9_018746 isoform 4-T4 [Mantella aurantiaca]